MLGNITANWSTPTQTTNWLGEVEWKREWVLPREYHTEFFKYWKTNGDSLKLKGINVYKKDSDWIVCDVRPKKDDFPQIPAEHIVQPITVKKTDGLRPWQVEAVGKLCAVITNLNAAIDGSDLGTGKSYTAIGVARELGMKIFIVCPKAMMITWKRVVVNHFKMEDDLVGIINYESLRNGRTDSPYASIIKCRKTKTKKFTWKIPKNTLIIWDESQKLKGAKTKNSKSCLAAIDQGYKMLFCSATMATNPLELRTVGMALKLFKNNKEYYPWLYAHGVSKGRFGLEFNGNKEILKKLHNDIFINRGNRLTRDIIPNFPESQISAECYDMEADVKSDISKIYREMKLELLKLNKKIKKDKNDGVNQLTVLLRAREKIELLKLPLFVEMIENGIESGMSIAVFLNFTASIHALAERLNTKCIVNGEITGDVRQKNIDDFVNNKEKVIIINCMAGGAGIGLPDLDGKHPRLALISPSYSAVVMRQITGRVWRESSKSKSVQKIVFCAGTVEEDVCNLVKIKLDNLDLLNDGDLAAVNVNEF